MAFALTSLMDKKKMALTRARFRAWWEGAAFDEEAARAALEAGNDAGGDHSDDVESALFDALPYEPPSRIAALMMLWGPGRCRPGEDAADQLEPARLGLDADGRLAILGPGLVGPVKAVCDVHPGPVDVFEWREEVIEALRAGVKQARLDNRVSVTLIDLEAYAFPVNHFDAVWSIDDFAYCGHPPSLAQHIYKALKPNACASLECYVGLPDGNYAAAYASSFAEPQIRAHGDLLGFFTAAGFALEADEDMTTEFFRWAREGFQNLGAALSDQAGLDVLAAQELAWEAAAWRTRLRLLAQRRLERRRFLVRKVEHSGPEIELDAEAQEESEPLSEALAQADAEAEADAPARSDEPADAPEQV